eukprot:gnl/Spiro4/22740_TR11232_c0_g1_i1.p1 gnl/Spiro4/22740_TR11232_c0_g1~~gnl/Spiro4/22740_TR11232_c0_g1_i1.p1  ORF type:complete len:483 (+),score=116.53 gnl/Spiro4/22740_TR11232_c0_g1_i1:77-1525(+)
MNDNVWGPRAAQLKLESRCADVLVLDLNGTIIAQTGTSLRPQGNEANQLIHSFLNPDRLLERVTNFSNVKWFGQRRKDTPNCVTLFFKQGDKGLIAVRTSTVVIVVRYDERVSDAECADAVERFTENIVSQEKQSLVDEEVANSFAQEFGTGEVEEIPDNEEILRQHERGVYPFAIIADLDRTLSCKDTPDKWIWCSIMKRGALQRSADGKYDLQWSSENPLSCEFSTRWSRGLELSELVKFRGQLLTFDKHTGIVFHVNGDKLIPREILPDGDGQVDSPFKVEWATVKDGVLVVGGSGRETLNIDRTVRDTNPQYVKILRHDDRRGLQVEQDVSCGAVQHVWWKKQYDAVRRATGSEPPGHVTIESGTWNPELRRWFFLPRDIVKDPARSDGVSGGIASCYVACSEDFWEIRIKEIPRQHPDRVFSSFKFIPGRPEEILAIKTVTAGDRHATYMVVFNLYGEILMDEKYIVNERFEGVEFL